MRIKTNKILISGLLGFSLMASNLHAEDTNVATVNGQAISKETLNTVVEMVKRSTQGGETIDNKTIL